MSGPADKGQLLQALGIAAAVLETKPFETVTLEHILHVAKLSDLSAADLAGHSMHSLGAGILAYEGDSMRRAQARAANDSSDSLSRLRLAFRYVGENLERDRIVRAGVRIAGESHHRFPERKIDPFRTWRGFITEALREAQATKSIRDDADLEGLAWILTASGLGTKDLLAFTGEWHQAPDLLEYTAAQFLTSVKQAGGGS